MEDYTLPTPSESGYVDSPELQEALLEIQRKVNAKIFTFEPNENWDDPNLVYRINRVIFDFGWKLTTTRKPKWDIKNEQYTEITWVLSPK